MTEIPEEVRQEYDLLQEIGTLKVLTELAVVARSQNYERAEEGTIEALKVTERLAKRIWGRLRNIAKEAEEAYRCQRVQQERHHQKILSEETRRRIGDGVRRAAEKRKREQQALREEVKSLREIVSKR